MLPSATSDLPLLGFPSIQSLSFNDLFFSGLKISPNTVNSLLFKDKKKEG